MSTTISPIAAAEAVGLDPYELARYLRTAAFSKLTALAGDIERGGWSNRGDVDYGEFVETYTAVWRIVEAAQACDAQWQAEIAAPTEEEDA